MPRLLRILLALALACVLLYFAVPLLVFRSIPNHNTSQTHFDTLIVLGSPSNRDGSVSPEERERVDEGVREYRAGVAPYLIMTGGAAHNQFVEAHVMAGYAVSQGVPRSAIFEEGQALNTIQNIWYSRQIMTAQGWQSAEVISGAYHLPRTALILQHYTGPLAFAWRTHAARWPREFTVLDRVARTVHEAMGCVQLRLHGFRSAKFLPNP